MNREENHSCCGGLQTVFAFHLCVDEQNKNKEIACMKKKELKVKRVQKMNE